MKIDTNPIPFLPRTLTKESERMPEPERAQTVVRLPALMPGCAPLYRVALSGTAGAVGGFPQEKLEGILRIVSEKMAEQLGTAGKVANAVFWFSVDAKRLHDHWHDAAGDGTQRVIDIGRLAGTALGAVAAVPGLHAAGAAVTPLYVVADLGESIHTGKTILTQAAIAGYTGADPTGVMQITELLTT